MSDTIITDRMAELQQERIALARKLQDIGKREVKDWGSEDQALWTEVETRYDEVVEEIDKLDLAGQRAAKLSRLADQMDRERQATRSEIGEARQLRSGKPTEEQRALALQGWMRYHHGLGLDERHLSALDICRFDPQRQGFMAPAIRHAWPHGAGMWSTGGGARVLPADIEHRDLAVSSEPEIIPTGFVNELETTLKQFGGLRRIARVYPTSTGNPMPWPTMNDTANVGELLAEATTIGASVDPAISDIDFSAFKYSSKLVLVSAELLEDSAFNLASELGQALGIRIGRITATHFATGTGVGQPQGVTVGASSGVTGVSIAGGGISGNNLIDLQGSIDPAYEAFPSIGWAMNKATMTGVRKLRDDSGAAAGTGNYLWQPGLQAGTPDMLLGSPVAVIQEMPGAGTATNRPVVYGAWEKYIIRDAGMFRFYRLDELHRGLDQTGFIAFSRHDGRVIQAAALKYLVMAA